MTTLTTAQVRALTAVCDGLVEQRFDRDGNVFVGPKGIGPVLYRKLKDARLIEDVPGQKVTAPFRSFHKQQLTKAGHDALRAANTSSRSGDSDD